MKTKSILALAVMACASAMASAMPYPSSEAVPQPDDLTHYAKCQLDHPNFELDRNHKHQIRDAVCIRLSNKITDEHFAGDFAKFRKFWLANQTAIVMEVKSDWN